MTVTRDRLARSSTFDLFGIVKRIVYAKAAVPILGRTVGRHPHQHRYLMLAVLGGLGDVERDLARARRRQEPHLDQAGAAPNRCRLRGRVGIALTGATGGIGTGTVFRSHMFTITTRAQGSNIPGGLARTQRRSG